MNIKLIGICLVCCLILALAPFLNLPVMPTNTSFISSYGAYLSGTVAPCIALFAYFGVLKALKLQREQLKQLSEETRKQDIARCLEKYEALIKESLLNHNIAITINGSVDHTYNLYQVMTMPYFLTTYQQAVNSKSNYLEAQKHECLMKFESLCTATLYITRMSEYIRAYKEISTDYMFIGYYYNKYKTLAERLHELEYLEPKVYDFWEKKLTDYM